MAISLEEINTLVWRYLNENGFQHSAFLFKSESMVDAADSSVSNLPSGYLVSLLQKSLLYLRLEKRVNEARDNPEDILHKQISEIEKYFSEPLPKPPDEKNPEIPSDQPLSLRISSSIASILTIHKQCVFACAFSPDGSLLGTGSEDGTAIIWKLNDGVYIDSKTVGYLVDDQNNDQNSSVPSDVGITSVDFDSTGKYFATGSFDSFVRLYDTNGNFLVKMPIPNHNIFTIKFSPSGKYLISCSDDKAAILWNIPSGTIQSVFMHHTETVLGVSWRDDNVFATASSDNCIGICHINGRSRLLAGHQSQVNAVSWSPDGTMLASSSEDTTVRVWKINNPEELFNLPSLSATADIKMPTPLPNVPNIHAYGNIPSYPNIPHLPNMDQVGNIPNMQNMHAIPNYQNIPQNHQFCSVPYIILAGHESSVSCVSWIPHSQSLLVSADQNGSIRLWDALKGTCLMNLSHHKSDIIALSCSPDGKYIASGGSDQTIDILNVSKQGELLATFTGSSTVYDVQWDPKGRNIAACFDDSTVAIIPAYVYLK